MSEKNCGFCNFKVNEFKHLEKYGLRNSPDTASIVRTKNIVVKPDILPVSPDGLHLLMIPLVHQFSFASLSGLDSEVGNVIYQVENIFQRPFVFFEHGSIKGGANKIQSVFHQHGHLIPNGDMRILDYMIDRLKKAYDISYQIIDTPDESPIVNLKRYCPIRSNYLYIKEGRRGLIAYDDDPVNIFPSQITQKSMSRLLSGRELDWKRINKEEELAFLSAQRIAALIERCEI